MADILVLGANGFLGSHLVEALALEGHSVTAFDRFSTRPTFDPTGIRILPGDFLSRSDLEQAVRGQQLVLHFLSTTTPATAEDDPTLDVRTNLAQSIELLESCVHAGVEHVYFASTGGAIYGPQGKNEYSEEDRALPISPYGIGKLTVEHYLDYFRAKHGLSSTALRISNPYGPRQRGNRKQGLIPIALRQVALGRPVVRFGDGTMVRDYLFVEDLVRMVTALVGRETRYPIYNVGSGTGHSVNEVLEAVRTVTGHEIEIEERPTPSTFVDRVVLSTERFSSEFGVGAVASLEDGITRTWEDVRDAGD